MQDSAEAVLAQVAAGEQALVAVAMDGTVVAWNGAAAALLGVPTAAALGRPCAEVLRARTPAGAPACARDCPALARARAGRPGPPEDLVANRRRVRAQQLVLRDLEGRPAVLLHLLDDVAASRSVEAVGRRAQRLFALAEHDGAAGRLTRREREVLVLLCRGLTARDVARRLGVSYTTARTHVQRLNAKLGVHTRAAAVAAALAELES